MGPMLLRAAQRHHHDILTRFSQPLRHLSIEESSAGVSHLYLPDVLGKRFSKTSETPPFSREREPHTYRSSEDRGHLTRRRVVVTLGEVLSPRAWIRARAA